MVTVLLLEVFTGPTAALPATIFLGIVVGILVISGIYLFSRGSGLYVSYS